MGNWASNKFCQDASFANYHLIEHEIVTKCQQSDDRAVALISANPSIARHRYCHNGETLLHIAARCNRVTIIKALLSAGAEMDTMNDYGVTALYEACYWSQKEAAKYLASEGANPHIEAKDLNIFLADDWV